MTMIPKQRLCGESYESVAEPLMAAVDRSLDPSSEWHERREALYDVIRHVPLASFDKAAQQRLRALGVVPESDEATPGATASMPSSDEAEDDDPVAESEEATGESEEAVVDADRFVPVKKLSTRHRKAFRCKHCRFAWVERVSALAKRDQRTRRCLCVDSVLPHKYFCTRNAKVDLKNIRTFLKHTGATDWRVDTTSDEFKNSRITVRLKHKQTKHVKTVVLRPLLARKLDP